MINHQIESYPLWTDITSVMHSGPKDVRFELRGLLHTEKEDLKVLKIISLDVVRDYMRSMGDRVIIEFKMPLGEYTARLYPYRRNLEFSLKRLILSEGSGSQKPDSAPSVERYKAVFIAQHNPQVGTSELEMIDPESLNKVDIVTVKLELLDRSLEPIRAKTAYGIFRNVKHKDLIRGVLGGESTKILVDGKPSIDAIDVVEPNNQDPIKHLVIPQGTPIFAVPSYLQANMGGVYNAGIGTYLQRYNNLKTWFVYPTFDIQRFDKGDIAKAIFYAVPSERLPGLDRTFLVDGQVLKILANSTRKYKDSADVDYMNHGIGFKQADANAYMKKPVKITEDGPVGQRTSLNNEMAHATREDGLTFGPPSDKRISSNPYTEYTKVLARNVARLDLVWESADISLLYPGMPCKYVFIMNDKQIELKGIIGGIHALYSLQGTSITSNVYKSVCAVHILLEKHTTIPELPIPEMTGEY